MFGHRVPLIYTLLGLLLVFAVVTLAGAFTAEGWLGALQSASNLGMWTLIVCILLTLVNYLLRFVRWNRYLGLTKRHSIPPVRHCLIYIAGFSMTTTPGKVGELARAAWLEGYGITFGQVTAVCFLERTLDVLALLILAAFTITLFVPGMDKAVSVTILAIVIGCFLFGLLSLPYLSRYLLGRKAFNRLTLRRFAEAASNLGPGEIAVGLNIGLLAWFAEGFAFWLILQDLVEVESDLLQTAGIYATSLLAGALSFIPGGLVATEMTLGAGLTILGVAASQVIVVVVLTRLITLWFGVLVGFVALTVIGRPLAAGEPYES